MLLPSLVLPTTIKIFGLIALIKLVLKLSVKEAISFSLMLWNSKDGVKSSVIIDIWANLNALYSFERNLEQGKYEGKDVEDIIKRTIESKLRMEWAEEFFDFYNLPTLSPEEVVKGMGKGYTQADLPRDINERFAYMTALITADEEQVESCREFIRKYCDSEYLTVFDIYWVGNNERKMEKISELQENR